MFRDSTNITLGYHLLRLGLDSADSVNHRPTHPETEVMVGKAGTHPAETPAEAASYDTLK